MSYEESLEEYREKLKTSPSGGWAKVLEGQNADDVPSIHIGPVPQRKRPALYVLDKKDGQHQLTILASFRDEASARVAVNLLNDFLLHKNEENE